MSMKYSYCESTEWSVAVLEDVFVRLLYSQAPRVVSVAAHVIYLPNVCLSLGPLSPTLAADLFPPKINKCLKNPVQYNE